MKNKTLIDQIEDIKKQLNNMNPKNKTLLIDEAIDKLKHLEEKHRDYYAVFWELEDFKTNNEALKYINKHASTLLDVYIMVDDLKTNELINDKYVYITYDDYFKNTSYKKVNEIIDLIIQGFEDLEEEEDDE